jgi:type I restriction enzyme R subunit
MALQLKRKFENPTVLVVTDRRQLDKQITSTFTNCGFPNPIKASDRENLKSLIENNIWCRQHPTPKTSF